MNMFLQRPTLPHFTDGAVKRDARVEVRSEAQQRFAVGIGFMPRHRRECRKLQIARQIKDVQAILIPPNLFRRFQRKGAAERRQV